MGVHCTILSIMFEHFYNKMLREKNLSQVMVPHALKLSVASRKSKNLNTICDSLHNLFLLCYSPPCSLCFRHTVSHTPCSLNPAPLNELFPLPGIFNNHPSSQHTPKPGLLLRSQAFPCFLV